MGSVFSCFCCATAPSPPPLQSHQTLHDPKSIFHKHNELRDKHLMHQVSLSASSSVSSTQTMFMDSTDLKEAMNYPNWTGAVWFESDQKLFHIFQYGWDNNENYLWWHYIYTFGTTSSEIFRSRKEANDTNIVKQYSEKVKLIDAAIEQAMLFYTSSN